MASRSLSQGRHNHGTIHTPCHLLEQLTKCYMKDTKSDINNTMCAHIVCKGLVEERAVLFFQWRERL